MITTRIARHAGLRTTISRQQFYKERIVEVSADSRKRWTAIRDVLQLSDTTDIRLTRECRSLSEKFAAYFVEKIRKFKTAI